MYEAPAAAVRRQSVRRDSWGNSVRVSGLRAFLASRENRIEVIHQKYTSIRVSAAMKELTHSADNGVAGISNDPRAVSERLTIDPTIAPHHSG